MGKKLKNFITEFKTFAIKGNMIDLAVGVIIGGAFSKITNSLVNDVAMPLVSIFAGVNFTQWKVELPRIFESAEPNYLNFGVFLGNIFDFVILALTVFIAVKAINKVRNLQEKEQTPPPPPAPSEPTAEERLLTEIRDLLKAQRGEE